MRMTLDDLSLMSSMSQRVSIDQRSHEVTANTRCNMIVNLNVHSAIHKSKLCATKIGRPH